MERARRSSVHARSSASLTGNPSVVRRGFRFSEKKSIDVIADVLAGKPLDERIYHAGDESADSPPERAADHARRHAEPVTRHVAVNGRDNGQMLQRIDDVDQIAKTKIAIFPEGTVICRFFLIWPVDCGRVGKPS